MTDSNPIISPPNPTLIGDVLFYYLTSKYSSLNKFYLDIEKSNQPKTTSEVIKKWNEIPGDFNQLPVPYTGTIKDLIKIIYKNYLGIDVDMTKTETVQVLQGGDILDIKGRTYIITQYFGKIPQTWPLITEEDKVVFSKYLIGDYKVIRPNFNNSITVGKLKNLAKNIIKTAEKDLDYLFEENRSIKFEDISIYGDGALQIGDLIFLVDPTQLSFNTQNGYQYFPTIRTQGNPKIPTMEYIKNISINLIFPNEDSINYQLLHLYAMFRRTPFVNIRNADISEFFKEICNGEWLSVGLESIQIQSVEGFPNTLQASITVLPFDYKSINSGFKALLSLTDVKKQQKILYKNEEFNDLLRKAESKLEEQSIVPERLADLVINKIDSSLDFRESSPFRAFYQSLIKDRTSIKDVNGNNISMGDFSFESFRPANQNFLNEYISSNNNQSVKFKYSYISEEIKDFQSATRILSKARLDKQTEILGELNTIYENMSTPQDIANSLITAYANRQDFFKITDAQFRAIKRAVPTILAQNGITIEQDLGRPISDNIVWGTLEVIWGGLGTATGLTQAKAALNSILNLVEGRGTVDGQDIVGLKNGLYYVDAKGDGRVGTFEWGIKKIYEWINDQKISKEEQKKRKAKFLAFIKNFNISIQEQLGIISHKDTIIGLEENSQGGELFKVSWLPISEKTIEIDNKKDIITGWSLVFANKFVPISLQSFDYPYYQHLGSEDPVLSLSIFSTSEKPTNLKSNLSEMSQRLYQTAKLIQYCAPELLIYMDNRLKVEVPVGHIFNVFGIEKLTLDSSNTTNVEGKPNCWNTVMNMTQSNFTIEEYHQIIQVPTNQLVREEFAKFLMKLEIDDSGARVIKYVLKEPVPINQRKEISIGASDYLRFRFLNKFGPDLFNYLRQAEEEGKKANEGTGILINMGFTAQIVGQSTQTLTSPETAKTLELFKKTYDELGIEEVIDSEATEKLNQLIQLYPNFKKQLKFLTDRINTIMAMQLNSFKQIIQPNYSFFQNFLKNINSKLGWSGALAWSAVLITSILLMPAITGVALPTLIISSLLLSATTSGGVLANTLVRSGIDAGETSIKNFIIEKFNGLFLGLSDIIGSSVIFDFADKLIKDPVMFKKLFVEAKILSPATLDKINSLRTQSVIGCYPDFDLPNFGEDIVVGPDFYLFNNIIENIEMRDYINEATKRYAKIGKLSAMMCLVDAQDSLRRYDEILKNTVVLPEIKEKLDKITYQDLFGDKTQYTNKTIEDLIQEIQGTLDNISVADRSISESLLETNTDQKTKADEILKNYEDNFKSKMSKQEFESGYNILKNMLMRVKGGIPIGNLNYKKLNLIYAARTKTMLEIFYVYSALNKFMQGRLKPEESKKLLNVDELLTKTGLEKTTADNLNKMLQFFITNSEQMTSSNLEVGSFKYNTDHREVKINENSLSADQFLDNFRDHFKKGNAISETGKKTITSPAVFRLENYLYNKMSYFMRLNSALEELSKNQSTLGIIDLTNLPELAYLDFWNFRSMDENLRKLKILKEFTQNQNKKKDTTIKMFPTYKIFFIEENKNIISHNFDDYFTQNAIQTIEIVKNKNSPSITALIRFSNITGNLTDKMSLLRETEDYEGTNIHQNLESKKLFFGTLDVKPGTQVLIKMGYAPYDNLLYPVFHGRIIEMNVGPVVEMVCQSFGAQLNHEILGQKYGFFSNVREHGDVASSILDEIPGLEKLGKLSEFGTPNLNDFTGRNIRNINGKFGDRYLMSNLIGSLNSMTFAQDNPRDENIYLNYSAANTIWHHPTFDWVVAEQTVWEALNELSLYHPNSVVTTKPFNQDGISTYNDLRETLIIGNKAGYYKYTDAFSLTSLNIKEVDRAKAEWDLIKNDLLNPNLKLINSISSTRAGSMGSPTNNLSYGGGTFLTNPQGVKVYSFLQNRLNALVLVAHLIAKNQNTVAGVGIEELIGSVISNSKLLNKNINSLIFDLVTFSKMEPTDPKLLHTYNFLDARDSKIKLFNDIVNKFRKEFKDTKDKELFMNLNAEEYYNVKDIVTNIDEKMIFDPQYKKIQTHHLITDSSDIISNNISLNSNFSNMVNVYYPTDPSIERANASLLPQKYIEKKVNVWTIKAFGDQRDEFCRPLNSYQKNVDTNWFDIADKTLNFFNTFQRVNLKGIVGNTNSSLISKLKDNKTVNYPYWDILPSFYVVSINLLKKEVSKMYQGTIEIVGNPDIQPFDILHIQDYTNDMHGVVEVEEVIHTFTPEKGFRTVITPNLITYDRDPIQLQDVSVINQIYDFAGFKRGFDTLVGFGGLAMLFGGVSSAVSSFSAGNVFTGVGGSILALGGAGLAWNGFVGGYKRYHKFLYDSMGSILGRDCINFTSLLYHGMPYMTGFDGVDYTNLKTLMNHTVANIKNPVTRFLAFNNTFAANMVTGFRPEEISILQGLLGSAGGIVSPMDIKGGLK